MLTHPAFGAGRLSTGFIDEHFENGAAEARPAGRAAAAHGHGGDHRLPQPPEPDPRVPQAHGRPGRRRPTSSRTATPTWSAAAEDVFEVCLRQGRDRRTHWTVTVDGDAARWSTPDVRVLPPAAQARRSTASPTCSGSYYQYSFFGVAFCGTARIFEVFSPREWELAAHMPAHRGAGAGERAALPDAGAGGGRARAEGRPRLPRPGPGEHRVHEDGKLRRLALRRRVVDEVLAGPGQAVETDEVLVRFKA
ncbi:MAG: hypothetical protein MZU95_10815 [Desulfomicrobium escambiense]|nr:hypothetical protein [Desulfomicrobium escambiense]